MGSKLVSCVVFLMGQEKDNTIIAVAGRGDNTLGQLIDKLRDSDKRPETVWMLSTPMVKSMCGTNGDISQRKFGTNYRCTLLDAPANHDFIKNMITATATSQADCTILIIDSTTGVCKDEIRQHALLARTLGVKHIICCCDMMDATTPKYSKARYDEIVKELSDLLMVDGYNCDMIDFVPISGSEGDNLFERSTNLDWYYGPTLFEAIDQIQEPKTPSDKPLRAMVKSIAKKVAKRVGACMCNALPLILVQICSGGCLG